MESAWDSTGRRKPQSHAQNEGFSSLSANEGAVGGAAAAAGASAWEFKPKEIRDPEGGESLGGAEAMLVIPQKGNNVSSDTFIIV